MKAFVLWLSIIVMALTLGLYGKDNGLPVVYSKQRVAEIFFHELLENTPAGYVLVGPKPVYLGSFLELDRTIPGTEAHCLSATTLLLLEIWKESAQPKPNAECLFAVKNNEFLLINRKQFLRVVKDNLSLFQYKLGVDVSPEGLLDSLLDPTNSFSSLLQENISLQGILLGYGVGNSITYEKGSCLMKPLRSPSIVAPYRSPASPKTESEMLQKLETSPEVKKNWRKLTEEMQRLTFYKPMDAKDRLKIPFSFHPHTAESEKLLAEYRQGQKNVDALIANKDFLKTILSKLKTSIKSAPVSYTRLEDFFTEEEKMALPHVVAASICNAFQEEMSPAFIEGMQAAQSSGLSSGRSEDIKFFEVRKSRTVTSIKILPPPDAYCLIPQKLYFQTLKQGHSQTVLSRSHQSMQVRYFIEDLSGNKVAESALAELDLKEMIPGLAHGMLGMNEGEVREIIIHPDFAYGIDSSFANGQPIRVQVELLKLGAIPEQGDGLRLKMSDPYAPEISSCSEFVTLQNKYFQYCGSTTWAHYKKAAPLVTLETILPLLDNVTPLTSHERNLLLKLEWLLYSTYESKDHRCLTASPLNVLRR